MRDIIDKEFYTALEIMNLGNGMYSVKVDGKNLENFIGGFSHLNAHKSTGVIPAQVTVHITDLRD